MGWGDELGRHEGYIVRVFADGRFGGGVERGGIPLYAANGLAEMDSQGNSVEVRPAAAVIGWRVACFHAPSYVGDDDLAVRSGQPQFWTGPTFWRRVYSPAEEDLAAGQICASLAGDAGDLCVEDRDDVFELMHAEWRTHVVPDEHARSIRRSLQAVTDAVHTVDFEVAAARGWPVMGRRWRSRRHHPPGRPRPMGTHLAPPRGGRPVKIPAPEATLITAPTGKAPLSPAWLREQYLVNRLTSEQIAVQCGWSSQYVRDQLRRAGIPLRPPGGGGPDGTGLSPARLNALVGEGLSVAQIADVTGYSQAGVYKRLRRSGLTVRPQKTPPDPERAVEVARLYQQGLSLTVVGARFQRGPEWVKAQLREVGVELRPGGPVPAALDYGQVRELLATGHSVAEIAAATGRAESTVRQLIRSEGWATPGRRASTSRLPPLDAAMVGRLYAQERRTIAEIAAQLHCSPDRVRQTLVAAGVPRRLPGRRDDLRPPPITATELRELYVDQDLTIQEVARRLGCSSIRVTAALDRHQIARHRDPHRHHRAPGLDLDADTLTRLYVLERLDDAAIGARYAVPAWRVRRRRRELGVSRPRPAPPHPAPPNPPPADVLQQLYLVEKLPLVVIARRHHTSAPFVRDWLDDAQIPIQPRTARKHRRALDPVLLRQRYEQQECSAAEIAAELDTTVHLVLRALHDFGIPVRRGGTRSSRRARDQYQLLAALYADPDVTGFLKRHRIPQRPQRGPIATRFPQPIPLSEPLLRQAYVHLGLSARHIELLTGQPADQILDALHAAGIPVRVTSTPSPWLTRHRTG